MADNERLDRIEAELAEIKLALLAALALQRLIALKHGIVPEDSHPGSIPTPFDVLDGLLKRDRAAKNYTDVTAAYDSLSGSDR